MNNRLDVKISIVGCNNVDIINFSKILFMDKIDTEITCDPFKNELIVEVDSHHFKNSATNTIKELKNNNKIMTTVNNKPIDFLRLNNIFPFYCKHINRVKGLIDYNKKNSRLNKNILLSFYIIKNVPLNYKHEIYSSNIMIYVLKNNSFPSVQELGFIEQLLVKKNKYIFPVVDTSTDKEINETFLHDINMLFTKIAKDLDALSFILPVVCLNYNFIYYLRCIEYKKINKLNIENNMLCYEASNYHSNFKIKEKNIINYIEKNINFYYEKTGFNDFRNSINEILGENQLKIIQNNIDSETEKIFNFINDKLSVDKITNIISLIKILINKTNRFNSIYKIDWNNTDHINELLFCLFSMIEEKNIKLDISHIDGILDLTKNEKIIDKLKTIRNIESSKIFNEILKIAESTNIDDILNVDNLFKNLITFSDLESSNNQTTKIAETIFYIYTEKINTFLDKENISKIISFYLDIKKISKFVKILDCLKEMLIFQQYKYNLVKILLSKLFSFSYYLKNYKENHVPVNINKIIDYLSFFKYYISTKTNKKYGLIYSCVIHILSGLLDSFLSETEKISYLMQNLDQYIAYDYQKILYLECFIIQSTKQSSYLNLISDDLRSSDDENIVVHENNNKDLDYIENCESITNF